MLYERLGGTVVLETRPVGRVVVLAGDDAGLVLPQPAYWRAYPDLQRGARPVWVKARPDDYGHWYFYCRTLRGTLWFCNLQTGQLVSPRKFLWYRVPEVDYLVDHLPKTV